MYTSILESKGTISFSDFILKFSKTSLSSLVQDNKKNTKTYNKYFFHNKKSYINNSSTKRISLSPENKILYQVKIAISFFILISTYFGESNFPS